MARPIRELLATRLAASPVLLWLMPICVVMTLSAGYELLEWGAARVVGPELGIAFVGAQGDIWDAQKDMALALAGSCGVTATEWLLDRVRRRPTPQVGG